MVILNNQKCIIFFCEVFPRYGTSAIGKSVTTAKRMIDEHKILGEDNIQRVKVVFLVPVKIIPKSSHFFPPFIRKFILRGRECMLSL